jgi:hypothetical protein
VSVRPFGAVLFVAPLAISLGPRTAYGDGSGPAADRETSPQKLGVSAATSYLASGAGSGVAVSSGLRLTLGPHAALGADLGYGVLSATSATQDRWWIIPTIAWVVPTEYMHLDLGVGLGVGASSGYASFGDYAGSPFSPAWAFQLVPAARAHVMWSTPLGRELDAFARVDVAALVLSGTQLGFRHGDPNPGPGDTTWFTIGAGVQFRLL